jgi:hypothetical protein
MNRSELTEHLKIQTKHVKDARLYEKVLEILERAQVLEQNLKTRLVADTDIGRLTLVKMWCNRDRYYGQGVLVELNGNRVLEIDSAGSRYLPDRGHYGRDELMLIKSYKLPKRTDDDPEIHEKEVMTYLPGPWENFLFSKEMEALADRLAAEQARELARARKEGQTRALLSEEQEIARKFGIKP